MTRNTETKTCECCEATEYSKAVLPVDTFRRKVLPDHIEDAESLCRDCAEENDQFDAAKMTDEELIAGIISDSIGYASPRHAAFHVSDYRQGKKVAACERGGAVFGGDLDALIERAGRHFIGKSDEEKHRLLAKVEKWKQIEDDDRVASMELSMMAPVGGL